MKIFVVNWLDRLNPQAGGAETHLHEVFSRLAAWGHGVTLLTSGFPGGSPRESLDGMEIHRVGKRMSFGLRVPGFVKKAQGLEDFDVVVEDLNKVPLFMPFWTRVPVVPLVHHLFGSTAFQTASLPVAALTWLLERPIPRVFRGHPTVVVSRSTAEDLRSRGMIEEQIIVVPNGVNLDRLSPLGSVERFSTPTILYLGRLKRYKGVDLILKAMASLRRAGYPVRFLVAGKGDYEGELRKLSGELGLGDAVDFLGYVSEDRKLELFRRSWVHALTSPKEGWGISILEAAACGTPTVASDSPGLRDAVRDGDTGRLVPHGDVGALSSSLGTLLKESESREAMGKRARAFAEEFTWERSARRMEAFLEDRVAGIRPLA